MQQGAIAPVRLAIVDDHPLLRAGFRRQMEAWPQGTVVLEAEHGIDYARQHDACAPIDIAVVDLCMPERDGYETIQWIHDRGHATRTLAISFDASPMAARRVLLAGGHGLVGKQIRPPELFKALDDVHHLGCHMNELWRHAHAVQPRPGTPAADRAERLAQLSTKELEWFRLYIHPGQFTMRTIADRMGVCASTADTYRDRAFDKLGVDNRNAAIYFAVQVGLVGREGR